MSSQKRKREIENEALIALGLKPKETIVEKPVVKSHDESEADAAEAVAARAGVNQPKFSELLAHMERFGPDGILESARHLSEEQFEKLSKRAKRMVYSKEKRKWV